MNTWLKPLGWNESFQLSFESINPGNLIPARLIRENRGQFLVNTGNETTTARLSGAVRKRMDIMNLYPTVGDWLGLEPMATGADLEIRHILPRTSLFERQAAGKTSDSQSVAANFDYLFLVNGLDGDFNMGRIQRYLSLAFNSGAQPVVVLNKTDLVDDLPKILSEVQAVAPNVPIRTISALDPSSLTCLEEFFGFGKTIALLGSSGVGKSSLINALLGEERLATGSVREEDSRGRHTTTWRELVQTPNGSLLIDLPGMRELQLTEEVQGISKAFTDVEQLTKLCRFRNCQHNGEPGCAIEAAIEDGSLETDRFLQYLKLNHEAAQARLRGAAKKKPINLSDQARQEKENYFKEIHIKLRKEAKARRKYLGDQDF
jgi:ribosome biogenesis GTPase / thiamine phosphate phosphatase